MLLQSLVPSSVELTLPFAPNYEKQDSLCEWVPIKTQNSSKNGEYSKNGTDQLITRGSDANFQSSVICKRRKVQERSNEVPMDAVNRCPPCLKIEYDNQSVHAHNISAVKNEHGINHNVHASFVSAEESNRDFQAIHESVASKFQSSSFDKELISESFSSSKSIKRVCSKTSRTEGGNVEECLNSKFKVLDDDVSIKHICLSVLTSNGLLVGDWSKKDGVPMVLENNANSNIFQSCKLCGNVGNTLDMLLCDRCEEAFHVSCCNPRAEMLPIDEWFCRSCTKSNGKVGWSIGTSKSKLGPIEIMLKYPEPYISRVRIGNSFQAEVPESSDQLSDCCSDVDCIGEPLEIDPAGTYGLQVCSMDQFTKYNSMSNWLQCREVLSDDAGESVEGTICGKWRRAPLSEVQTDDWDCSCSVLWDPSRADCAVPQELETDQVLQQLKYIEQLRSRLAAKKRR